VGHGHDGFLVPPMPDPTIARGKGPAVERTLAARAASINAVRSQRLPWRVRPERCLPALSWWPGHRPLPLAACLALGKAVMSNAELGDHDLGGAVVHAGDGIEPGGKGRHGGVDGAEGLDSFVQVVEVGEELADEEGVVGVEAGDQRPP